MKCSNWASAYFSKKLCFIVTEVGDSRFTTSSAHWLSLSSRAFYLVFAFFVEFNPFVVVAYID
jgi:hypothetical protein